MICADSQVASMTLAWKTNVLSSLCSFWQQLSQRKVWAHLWTCAVTIATRLWRPSRLSPPPRRGPPWRTLPPPSPNFDLDSRTPASKWRLRRQDREERRSASPMNSREPGERWRQSSIIKELGAKNWSSCFLLVFMFALQLPCGENLLKSLSAKARTRQSII